MIERNSEMEGRESVGYLNCLLTHQPCGQGFVDPSHSSLRLLFLIFSLILCLISATLPCIVFWYLRRQEDCTALMQTALMDNACPMNAFDCDFWYKASLSLLPKAQSQNDEAGFNYRAFHFQGLKPIKIFILAWKSNIAMDLHAVSMLSATPPSLCDILHRQAQ